MNPEDRRAYNRAQKAARRALLRGESDPDSLVVLADRLWPLFADRLAAEYADNFARDADRSARTTSRTVRNVSAGNAWSETRGQTGTHPPTPKGVGVGVLPGIETADTNNNDADNNDADNNDDADADTPPVWRTGRHVAAANQGLPAARAFLDAARGGSTPTPDPEVF